MDDFSFPGELSKRYCGALHSRDCASVTEIQDIEFKRFILAETERLQCY